MSDAELRTLDREELPGPAGERESVLSVTALGLLRDLGASAVGVYLLVPEANALRAALVAVSSTGMGAVEEVPLTDDIFPSAYAYRTGEVRIGSSNDILERYPGLSVLIPFTYTIAAAPLLHGDRVLGTVTAYWLDERAEAAMDTGLLARGTDRLAARLGELARDGASLVPPRIPHVVSGAAPRRGAASASVLFHLHRLAVLLKDAPSTQAAAEAAIERMVSGFGARAAAIALTDAERLVVAGSYGCARDYLKSLSGARLNSPFPEAVALARSRHLVYPPADPRTRDRWAGEEEGLRCSWLILPLTAGDRAVGTCSLGFTGAGLLKEPLAMSGLSSMLSHTLERTKLNGARYALAEHLQEALLPRNLPQPPGVVSANRYRPAVAGIELGGDWYDVIEPADGGVGMVIGDVEGHNAEAAVVMGQLRSAVRAYAAEGHGPAEVLARTDVLLAGLHTGVFATCCCLWLDPDTGSARLATAGHPLPLLRTPDGEFLRAGPVAGPPLGVTGDAGDAAYEETRLTLPVGTLIALYTDGLVGPGEDLTVEAFEAALKRSGPELEGLADHLVAEADRLPAKRCDDRALLLVRYEGLPRLVEPNVRELRIHRRDMQGARLARHLLREWLGDWRLAETADEAELLMSEVVTNGIVHGDSDVSIIVRKYPAYLRVEVRDSDPRPAHAVATPRAEDQEEGGRGLLIVTTLAAAWGNSPAGRGKTVWFELSLGD